MYRRRNMVNWMEKQFKLAKKDCPEVVQKLMNEYVDGKPVRQRLMAEAGRYLTNLNYGNWITSYNLSKLAAKQRHAAVVATIAPPPADKKPGGKGKKAAPAAAEKEAA